MLYIYKMPVHTDDNKYCDVDTIITSFFTKYKEDILNILPIKLKNSLGKIEVILCGYPRVYSPCNPRVYSPCIPRV